MKKSNSITAPRVSVCCVNALRAPVPRSLSDSVQGFALNSCFPETSVTSAVKNMSKLEQILVLDPHTDLRFKGK